MAKPKFVWDYAAAGQLLLKSDEIADVCEREAAKMTQATGISYVSDVRVGKIRVVAGAYGKAEGENTNICPKCGEQHPNCRCGSSRK